MKYILGVIPTGRQSSAFGYSQALDGTWKEYRRLQGAGVHAAITSTMLPISSVGTWQLQTESLGFR